MHITFSMVLFMDKKNTETNIQKSNGHFCRKKPLISRSAFFLQSHSGAFMWKSFHRWCCLESSVWAHCQYLNGLAWFYLEVFDFLSFPILSVSMACHRTSCDPFDSVLLISSCGFALYHFPADF